jgi:hypothetical protein
MTTIFDNLPDGVLLLSPKDDKNVIETRKVGKF